MGKRTLEPEPVYHDLSTYATKRRRSNRSVPLLSSQSVVVEDLTHRRKRSSRPVGHIYTPNAPVKVDRRTSKWRQITNTSAPTHHVAHSQPTMFGYSAPQNDHDVDIFAGAVFDFTFPPERKRKVRCLCKTHF